MPDDDYAAGMEQQQPPKPPPDTAWIKTTEISDGTDVGAIYGVAIIGAALILVVGILLA